MQSKTLLKAVLNDLNDLKAVHISPLDVHKQSSITDFMVVATGTSSRHVRAIADNLINNMKLRDIYPIGVESDLNDEWLLVDLGGVVVHIMQPLCRDFYQLEKLWSTPASVGKKVSA